jgi:LytT family two-component system response regulator NatR
MLRVGLTDDRTFDLEKLIAVTSQLTNLQVVFATSDPKEAYEQIKLGTIDLLITDIEMPGLSGYELADLIRSHALEVAVIFVTAHSGYAVHAFELCVHDYIMKPYQPERLIRSIERFVNRKTEQDDGGQLLLKQKSQIHVIQKRDILFIERTGRSTTIVTPNEIYETYETLTELERQLPRKNFLRAHRSYIINVQYVKHFSLYTKNTYLVSFHHTDRQAHITKANLDLYQKTYF